MQKDSFGHQEGMQISNELDHAECTGYFAELDGFQRPSRASCNAR